MKGPKKVPEGEGESIVAEPTGAVKFGFAAVKIVETVVVAVAVDSVTSAAEVGGLAGVAFGQAGSN